jgi:hypothetical protein
MGKPVGRDRYVGKMGMWNMGFGRIVLWWAKMGRSERFFLFE